MSRIKTVSDGRPTTGTSITVEGVQIDDIQSAEWSAGHPFKAQLLLVVERSALDVTLDMADVTLEQGPDDASTAALEAPPISKDEYFAGVRRLYIASTGLGFETAIVDADTGRTFEVKRVVVRFDADRSCASASIELPGPKALGWLVEQYRHAKASA